MQQLWSLEATPRLLHAARGSKGHAAGRRYPRNANAPTGSHGPYSMPVPSQRPQLRPRKGALQHPTAQACTEQPWRAAAQRAALSRPPRYRSLDDDALDGVANLELAHAARKRRLVLFVKVLQPKRGVSCRGWAAQHGAHRSLRRGQGHSSTKARWVGLASRIIYDIRRSVYYRDYPDTVKILPYSPYTTCFIRYGDRVYDIRFSTKISH
jgi:hypothetical protein